MAFSRAPGKLSSRASSGIIASSHTDFDAMCAEMDQRVARATDAIIDDMPPRQKSSIYSIELGCLWPYHGEPDEFYLAAVVVLSDRLDRIGIT